MADPSPAFDGQATREWNADQEDEAQWLAGALLISDEAALSIACSNLSLAATATTYDVSVEMVRGRLNVTGARKRARNTLRGWSVPSS